MHFRRSDPEANGISLFAVEVIIEGAFRDPSCRSDILHACDPKTVSVNEIAGSSKAIADIGIGPPRHIYR